MSQKIPLHKISFDPTQPRKKIDPTKLLELAGSIEQNGLIQAITVRKARGGYIVVVGERRLRAHLKLAERGLRKFEKIDCHVRSDGAGVDNRIRQIAENLSRADLEPMEEARAFAGLVEEFGLTPAEIAQRLGCAAFRVDWRLSLLNLSPPIARLVETGQIDKQAALEAARLPNHGDQTKFIQMVNRGEAVGWKAQRIAVDTMLGATTAFDLFGDDAPRASSADVAVLSGMEDKINRVSAVVAQGWRNGECIIANKVCPDRAQVVAERIAAIRTALAQMERELRNTGAQAKIVLAR